MHELARTWHASALDKKRCLTPFRVKCALRPCRVRPRLASSSDERPRPHGPLADGPPPHRRRPDVPLQLALRARRGGECLLRIENTDTSREVAEATAQIERSLRWLGIEWDGSTRFQLDGADRALAEARRLVDKGTAYEDDGAIRLRMPDEGVIAWEDAVKGRIEFPAEELEDWVLVRSDGRPTYNFANPVDDWVDGVTHVIRGDDHVSNTPKQLAVLDALGAEPPVYAHVPNVFGEDGRKLSKRHGAVSVDEFRAGRLHRARSDELPCAARLGARWRDDDHGPGRARRALLTRPCRPEPRHLRLCEARLDERGLPARPRRGRLREHGARVPPRAARSSGPRTRYGRWRRSSRRRSPGSARSRRSRVSCSTTSSRIPSCSTGGSSTLRGDALARRRPVDGGGDRGRAEVPLRGARREAAHGLRADPRRGDGLEGVARPLRVARAARAGARPRAARARGAQVAA